MSLFSQITKLVANITQLSRSKLLMNHSVALWLAESRSELWGAQISIVPRPVTRVLA